MTTDHPPATPRHPPAAGRGGIGTADDTIIRAVGRLGYLTAEQLCRLVYSSGSRTYARARLARLATTGYLHRSAMPKASPAGSTPQVYTLGPKGRVYLARHGQPVPGRLRLSEVDEASSAHLQHALGVTDFLIAGELLCRARPAFRIQRMLTDRDLSRARFRVTLPGGADTQAGVAPDAWVDFRRRVADGTALQRCVTLEYDNNTEHQTAWRSKIVRLLAWARGPYRAYFGTSSLAVAVVTAGGSARADDLVRWTEAELQRQGDEGAGRYFYITAQRPAEVDPEQFFLSAGWRQPFGERLIALLTA